MSSSHESEKQKAYEEEKVEAVPDQKTVEELIEEEKQLVRKLDRRILPFVCLLYLFAYLDRTNLGNARLQGLPQEILNSDPTGVLFDWISSAFFFSYILCQVPATILSKLVPPRIWMAATAIGWGLCSTLMATTFNFGSIMTARVMLGVFEAGFGPAIPVYLSLFYTKEEIGLRIAGWFGFAAVAGAFGGILAFGIQNAHVAISNWKLLFIIEGTPPIILGILTVFYLPNRPESTSFLNERERQIAVNRMNRATSGDIGATVNKAHIGAAFRDWRVYIAGVIYFGLNSALASISFFLPTFLNTLFDKAEAQLLTVPPYAVAAVILLSFSWASDRLQTRGIFMTTASTIGAVGYLILLVVPTNHHARYFATFCIVSGTYATIGLIIAWFAHNLGSETKRATGIPMFMAIGQCGSVLGSHLFPLTDQPRYIKGFAANCGLEFLAALCAIVLSVSYRYDNAKRNRLYGVPEPDERVETKVLADKAPNFRYIP